MFQHFKGTYCPRLQGTRESFISTLKAGLHNPVKFCSLSTTLHLIPRDSNVGVLVICVLVFTAFLLFIVCSCIALFTYIYYLSYLSQCKDYCHQVTTQLQLVVVVIIMIIFKVNGNCTTI